MTYSPVRLLRRCLFWSHRWLGIATCLLCAMWFLSGLVMVYVPFPSWRDEERVATLKPLDAGRLAVTPGEALAKAKLTRTPTVFRLEMYGDEPVYRIVDFGGPTSISAVDGRSIMSVSAREAQERLQQAFGSTPVRYQGDVERDQWTVTRLFAPHRPLHLFSIDDGNGTQIYVSSKTGEIVQSTTRSERLWNWLGAVPHWIYFTPIRKDGELWRQVVMWTSGPAAIGAVLGIWIGIIRVRLRNRYASGRITPYRGWLKWHHFAGLLGGLTLATWVTSGWLSVSPLGLFNSMPVTPDDVARYYGSGTPAFEMSLPTLKRIAGPSAREVNFSWLQGSPIAIVDDGVRKQAYDAATGTPAAFTETRLAAAASEVFPTAKVDLVERLDRPDVYWYSHISQHPVPALRVGFDDPASTWLMIDMTTGKIAGVLSREDRIYRWVFNLVHQYDLPALLDHPYLRSLLIWLLSLLGIAISITGAVVGVRSLRR